MISYKKLQVRPEKPLTPFQANLVEKINSKFSRDDIYIECSTGVLELYLNRVDVEKLIRIINSSADSASEAELAPFRNMIKDILSIKSYGVRSGKNLYMNFDSERKVAGRKELVRNRGIHYYARNSSFSRAKNPLPENLRDSLISGDSEYVLKEFPDNCVDLIFTSPPYNFGLDYDSQKDGIDWEKYFEKLFSVFRETVRVLKYGGRIVVNVQPLYSDYIPVHHIISDFFMKNRLIWRNEIIWEKNNYNAKYTAWGSWKSPSNPYLKYTWEFLEVFSKGDLKHPGKHEDADISAEEFKDWVNARWNIAPERRMKDYGHPAMFPEKLAERVIKLFSFRNDVVMDPFNGVGTTTKVARDLGRRFVGIDVSETYVETARRRLIK